MRYVALLRGINVGGKNLIKMAALREAFEEMGFTDVATLIASGNVVFTAGSGGKPALTKKIEAGLDAAFDYASSVVVLSVKDLAAVVKEAPPAFGKQPARYRYDVLFVKPPLKARAALKDVPQNPAVDECFAGAHALYFRRLVAKATQSRLSRVTQLPLYKNLTIRNWNTTTKLLAMAEKK